MEVWQSDCLAEAFDVVVLSRGSNLSYTIHKSECLSDGVMRNTAVTAEGRILSISYVLNSGCFHSPNENTPAWSEFDSEGRVALVRWYQNGQLHRGLGPAVVHYDKGVEVEQHYYKHGVLHRVGGPARVIHREECWEEGLRVS